MPPQKKILFVIESLSGGGAEKVLATLAKHFDQNSYSVSVLSIVDVGIYRNTIAQHCEYHYVVPDTSNRNVFHRLWASIIYHLVYSWLPISWVANIFIPKGFDTVIAFVEGFSTKLVSKIKRGKVKRIAWVHCDLKEYPWTIDNGIFTDSNEEQEAYSQFDNIIVVSQNAKENFISKYGLSERTLYIQNPIDRSEIEALALENCSLPKIAIPRFITVGRLVAAKGFDRLIEASSLLHNEGFDFEIIVLGAGCDSDKLKSMASNKNIDSIIHFLGFKQNPYKYIKHCDCFICSSRTEGYSLAIAEAMCLGLPIISTSSAGPSEILDDGKYGMLVDNSTKGIYDGMKAFLTHSAKPDYSLLSIKRSAAFSVERCLSEIYKIF